MGEEQVSLLRFVITQARSLSLSLPHTEIIFIRVAHRGFSSAIAIVDTIYIPFEVNLMQSTVGGRRVTSSAVATGMATVWNGHGLSEKVISEDNDRQWLKRGLKTTKKAKRKPL